MCVNAYWIIIEKYLSNKQLIMLYELAHFLQNKVKPIWSLVEAVNAGLFRFRYGLRVRQLSDVVSAYPGVVRATVDDIPDLASFFSNQPEEAFEYFKPHGFDEESLSRLVKNPSMLMFVVKAGGTIVGYFFLRCFFLGKGYLGKMVDSHFQGQGIGQKMCCCAMDIATSLGIRMFETISKDNLASLLSTQKVLETEVVEEMENGYLYIEDIRKK